VQRSSKARKIEQTPQEISSDTLTRSHLTHRPWLAPGFRPARSTSTTPDIEGEKKGLKMREYIEHLEAELELAQARASPRTDKTSKKIRTLTVESKQLKAELAEWEEKYEERVQSGIDEYTARLRKASSDLRETGFRIHDLECDLEACRRREAELEHKLEAAQQTIDATEAGSVHLEKRLDVMSGLLASSPTKLNFHIPPHHARQRSGNNVPRMTNAAGSPERISFGFPFAAPPASPDIQADAEQKWEGRTRTRTGSMLPPHTPKANPARRMRRFGGSLGPKPLILPSTSYHEPAPLERNDSAMDQSGSYVLEHDDGPAFHQAGSPALHHDTWDDTGSPKFDQPGSPYDEDGHGNNQHARTHSDETPHPLPTLHSSVYLMYIISFFTIPIPLSQLN
jgi:hypothetical protein